MDAPSGTTGNDSFSAIVNNADATKNTINAGDSIVGAAGTDTLTVTASGAGSTTLAGFTLNGVEALTLQNASTTVTDLLTVNTTGSTGLANVTVTGSTADVTVSNLAGLVGLTAVSGSSDITLGYVSTVTSGTADTQNITLNAVSTLADSTITVNGVETLAVTTTGAASGRVSTTTPYAVTLAGDSIRTVTVGGDQAASLTVNLDGFASATNTANFNASAATGAVTAIVSASLADKVSIAGGTGNDSITMNTLSGSVSVSGGTGVDTVATTQTTLTQTDLLNISGVERFSLAASSSVDVTRQAAELTNVIYAAGTGASTLTGVRSGLTVDAQAAGTSLGVTVTGATTAGTLDALSINLARATSTGGIAVGTLTATGVETINVASLGTAATANTANTLTIAGSSVTAVNASGAEKLTLTHAGESITSYNASTATGAQNTASIQFSKAGAAVTGGSASDTLTTTAGADTVNGGAGNDAISAGAGNDVISGGDGNDNITGSTGADNLTGGAGVDTFVFDQDASDSVVNSTDTITDFTSGTDRISIVNGNNANPVKFVGNFATQADGLLAAAASANDNTQAAFFVTSTSTLYIDDDNNGALAADDVVIQLSGVTRLAEADLGLGSTGAGNSITLTAASANLTTSAATTTNATGPVTAFDDTITSQAANLTSSTVEGSIGRDTLVISDAVGTTGAHFDLGAVTSSVEVLQLATGTTGNFLTNVEQTTVSLGNRGDTIAMATGATSGVSITGGTRDDIITLAASTTSATVVGGAGNDNISVSTVAATSALNLNAGDATDTADVLTVIGTSGGLTDANLTGSTLTGFETLALDAAGTNGTTLTLTAAQYNAFTSITGDDDDNDSFVITTSGSITASDAARGYTLAAGSTITIGTATALLDTIIAESGTGATTIVYGGASYTGTYVNMEAGDVMRIVNNSNISAIVGMDSATVDFQNTTATVTLDAGQNGSVTIAGAATGTQTIALSEADTFTTDAAIEAYTGVAASAITLAAGHTAVNIAAGADATATTVNVGGQTVTGTYALDDGTDIITATTGANIAGINAGAATTAEVIDFDGVITMTATQYAVFDGATTGIVNTTNVAAVERVVLTTALGTGTTLVADDDVEEYALANGTNVFAVGAVNSAVTGGTGSDTVTVTATDAQAVSFDMGADSATDRLDITNAAIDPAHVNAVSVTNFNIAHDAIRTVLNATSITSGAYTAVAAGGNTAISAASGSIFEITGTNLANLADDADGGAVETAIINAFGTLTGTPSYTVVIYGGGNAGIYQITIADSGTDQSVTVKEDLSVEHIATLTGVAMDAMTSANFYS